MRVVSRWSSFIGYGVAVVMLTATAHAQTPDQVRADELFQEGRALAEQGDFKGACVRFVESEKLDPALGTVLNLADCSEKAGRLGTAIEYFRGALDALPAGDERIVPASKRLADLESRVPRLLIRRGPRFARNATVSWNAKTMESSWWDVPVRMDPGEHKFVVRTLGLSDRVYDLRLVERDIRELVVESGEAAQPIPLTVPRSRAVQPRAAMSTRTNAGYVLVGVGLAGITTGVITGMMVLDRRDAHDRNCTPEGCNPDGLSAAASGKRWLVANAAAWGMGLVASGLGVWLLVGANDREASASWAGVVAISGGAAVR